VTVTHRPALDAPPTDSGWPPWVEEWVLPFIEDSGLWPVLFALLGHVVVLVAPVLLVAWRSRSGAGLAPLVLLVGLSVWLVRLDLARRRGIGPLSAMVGLVWVAGVGLAAVCEHTGVL